MRRASLAFLALVPPVLLMGACGSSNTADLFTGAPPSAAAAAAAAADASPDRAPDEGSPDSGGATPEGGAATPDAAKPKDAGKPDVSHTPDAAPDVVVVPTDKGIVCGSNGSTPTYCNAAAQICCIRVLQGGLDFACKAMGSTCAGLDMPCSDTVDCAGQACCATYDNSGSGGYSMVACQATCGGSVGSTSEFRMCDPGAVVDECVASGLSCTASSAIPGWHICK